MAITPGSDIIASDFIQNPSSTSSADAGKVPVTTADGKIRTSFMYGGDCGDGRDGNISVSAGNINIDLGAAKVVVLNYNDVSVTGTGSVTFINSHTNGTKVIIRVKNRFKITSSASSAWNFDGCGAANSQWGSSNFMLTTSAGQAGYPSDPNSIGGTAGVAIGQSDSYLGFMPMCCGSGGGDGGNSNGFFIGGGGGGGASGIAAGSGGGDGICASTNNGAGLGGRGGGAMAVFAHEWEVSGTITGRGLAGQNGQTSPASGGGGGGGGCFYGRYHKLITNTGTYTMTGGVGGTNLGGAYNGGAGGNGWADIKELTLA